MESSDFLMRAYFHLRLRSTSFLGNLPSPQQYISGFNPLVILDQERTGAKDGLPGF